MKKNIVNESSSLRRRSATDVVERLSKRSRTESVKAKGHLLPSSELLFASLCPGRQDLILGFPVIEWDSDNEDRTDCSSDSEGGYEALCCDTAKLQVLYPIPTGVRPRRFSYPQIVMGDRECGLVRCMAFLSNLFLLDSEWHTRTTWPSGSGAVSQGLLHAHQYFASPETNQTDRTSKPVLASPNFRHYLCTPR